MFLVHFRGPSGPPRAPQPPMEITAPVGPGRPPTVIQAPTVRTYQSEPAVNLSRQAVDLLFFRVVRGRPISPIYLYWFQTN